MAAIELHQQHSQSQMQLQQVKRSGIRPDSQGTSVQTCSTALAFVNLHHQQQGQFDQGTDTEWDVCHPPMSMGQLTAPAWATFSIVNAAGICAAASTAASKPKKFLQRSSNLPDAVQHHIAGCCIPAWSVIPWTVSENDCFVQKMT